MKRATGFFWAAAVAGMVSAALFSGCELGSPKTAVRAVALSIAGLYRNPSGNLVSQNSGSAVTQMDLHQTGDQLQGIDNNNRVYNGSIGRADGSTATFTLEGATTAGARGTITGQVSVNGTSATMTGTWIEDTLTSQVYGEATVATNAAPTNTTSLAISPGGPVSLAVGGSQTFTATGGAGSYTWSASDGTIGTITGSGSSVLYTATAVGTQTVNVSDGTDSASATVNQN